MNQFDLDKMKKSFSSLIEGTTTAGEEYEQLETLLANYPYCQPLHMIHAASKKGNPYEFKKQLSKAAVYSPDREILYKFIYGGYQFPSEDIDSISPIPDQQLTVDAKEQIESKEPLVEGIEEVAEEKSSETEIVVETDFEEDSPVMSDTIPSPPEAEQVDVPAEPPIFDNIASSDYFTFNKSTVDPLSKLQEENETLEIKEEKTESESAVHVSAIDAFEQGEVQDVSKYHDEELPYTFLWWLQKTRKEHAHSYQPYVDLKSATSKALKKGAADELNHQIIENIFHLQVPLKDEAVSKPVSNTVEFALKRPGHKEYLIERFIKEEPQIRPPKAEKLDTENKARKSSEDNLDLVSETLAHIYIEQMLYHKAIDTYKKLSLKFPEKSTYFADQIYELQKKIS